MPKQEDLSFWADGIDDAERGRRMVAAQKVIANLPTEGYRRDMDLYNIRLYENSPTTTLYSYAGGYYADSSSFVMPLAEQSQNNKAKAAIDTFAALVFSTNQRARFVVNDGSYKQRRRARGLQLFADGLAHELNLHALRRRAGLDACILESGKGVIQFYVDADGRVAAQRALATEYSIDPLDGMIDGKPRRIYRRRPVARDMIKADFGTDKQDDQINQAIANAPPVTTAGAPGDHVEVLEAWSLPSSKDAGDGWHVVALDISDGVLCAEEHKLPFHTSVFYAVEDRFAGPWGLSFLTQARSIQCNINARVARILRTEKLFHAAHLYVDRVQKMKRSQMTNEIGTVWEGNGPNPPQLIAFQGTTAEMYAANDRDGALIFQNLGIPVGASQGKTDLGANAPAAAMREETKKADDRNSVRQQGWETFHLECMKVALALVRQAVMRSGKNSKSGYKVAVPGKRGLTVSDWRDVAIDEDDYIMEAKAANPLPTDPDGRIAYGERMTELGVWKPAKLADFLQDLDDEGRTTRQMSQERQFEKTFESLLYDDVAAAVPDEFTNVQAAMEIGTEYLAQGMEDGCPEKHVERVRRYLRRCQQLVTKASPPAQAAAAPTPPVAA